ncbi:hypothetical protein F5Y13DRAFT_198537 [Hypoxylon sp. FL1857]|nr:hypothetical protein F5Y13DRAFT_198537 [Hypoxylon sp. FL1857]
MSPDKSGKAVKAAARTLNGCVVAMTGSLGDEWNEVNVSRWVTLNGGVFSRDVDASVTHVLTTAEEFKKKDSMIKKALDLKAHIVTRDWLEDSLTQKRKLKEAEYSLNEAEKQAIAKKKLQEAAQKGLELGETFINPNVNRIYYDETFFRYEVTLTRDDEEAGEIGQKYVLYLWESIARPHLYHFMAKFYKKRHDTHPIIHRPNDTAGSLARELAEFKYFFLKKCGIDWDDRVSKAGTTPKTNFQYQPPTGGKPVGVFKTPAPHSWPTFGSGNAVAPAANQAPALGATQKGTQEGLNLKRKHEDDNTDVAGDEKRQRKEEPAYPTLVPPSSLFQQHAASDGGAIFDSEFDSNRPRYSFSAGTAESALTEIRRAMTAQRAMAGERTASMYIGLQERNRALDKHQQTEAWVASAASSAQDMLNPEPQEEEDKDEAMPDADEE